jgi:hypothetical protein
MLQSRLTLLYTNIGRGHPFYLDGIAEVLLNKGRMSLVRRQTDVFEISQGMSLLGWKAVRKLYRLGATEGLIGRIYSSLRRNGNYNRGGILQKVLGSSLCEVYAGDSDVLVVAHPSLVAMLANKKNLVYQHGELVTPREAVALGAEYVLVPTESVAETFHDNGYDRNQVIVTGLCIEPSLTSWAAELIEDRLLRINGQEPLTGAYFSSGAEPKAHVEKLVHAAVQAVLSGGRVILFARQGGRFLQKATTAFTQAELEYGLIDSGSLIPAELPPALVVATESRRQEDIFVSRFFPHFDYFMAPSHERTNWAVGLGLPMFIVGPSFGPFSPLNRQLLLDAGVAEPIDSVKNTKFFGRQLRQLRQHGGLNDMARAGWGKYRINGFEIAAGFLTNLCEQS